MKFFRHYAFLSFALIGCVHETPIEKIADDTFGFNEPTVYLNEDGQRRKVKLGEFRDTLVRQTEDNAVRLERADRYNEYARSMFWAGLIGGIISAVSDDQGYVPGRTTGNALWGMGWVSWLGFSGLAHAEWEDAKFEYNQSVNSGDRRDAGTEPSIQFRLSLGRF